MNVNVLIKPSLVGMEDLIVVGKDFRIKVTSCIPQHCSRIMKDTEIAFNVYHDSCELYIHCLEFLIE